MKKVLFISTKHSIFTDPVRRTFEKLGFDIKLVDYRDSHILMPGKFIHRAVGRLPNKVKSILYNRANKNIDSNILKTALAFKPDLIFVSKAKNIQLNILDQLTKIGKTINWYPDSVDHWERIQKIAPHYNFFFSFDSYVVDQMHKKGITNGRYLPFCADMSKETGWVDREYKYNIAFIGSFLGGRYTERENILYQLKDLGLHIWGNSAWLETNLKDCYQGGGRPSTEDMLDIYKHSKIVINTNSTPWDSDRHPGTGINIRPFEATASGSLLLNHGNREDIFKLFRDGEEFVSFEGVDDIKTKAKYYLENEEERLKIAKAGFEKTKREHTYLDRINKILETVQ